MFKALEHFLRGRYQFEEFIDAVYEYSGMKHAQVVPVADLSKPCNDVYYLLCMRCLRKRVLLARCGSSSTHLLKLHLVYH